MKIFNVLFPYPKELPIEQGDEGQIKNFFDGLEAEEKEKLMEDC